MSDATRVADIWADGYIPSDTEIVRPARYPDLQVPLFVLLGAMLVLWFMRQASLVFRAVGRLVTARCSSSVSESQGCCAATVVR